MPIVPLEKPVVDQHPEHLLDEQGVSFRGLRDAGPDVAGQSGPTQQIPDQQLALQLGQGLEHDQLPDAPPVGAALADVRTRRTQDEQGVVDAETRHVLEQVQQGRLGPVDVFDDHDERAVTGQNLEEPTHGPERLLDLSFALAEPNRRGYPLRDVGPVLHVADEIPHFGTRCSRRVQLADPSCGLDQLGDRPKGDPLTVGQASSPQRSGAGGRLQNELIHQSRLSESSVSDDGCDAADTLHRRLLERMPEADQLVLSPNQG